MIAWFLEQRIYLYLPTRTEMCDDKLHRLNVLEMCKSSHVYLEYCLELAHFVWIGALFSKSIGRNRLEHIYVIITRSNILHILYTWPDLHISNTFNLCNLSSHISYTFPTHFLHISSPRRALELSIFILSGLFVRPYLEQSVVPN